MPTLFLGRHKFIEPQRTLPSRQVPSRQAFKSLICNMTSGFKHHIWEGLFLIHTKKGVMTLQLALEKWVFRGGKKLAFQMVPTSISNNQISGFFCIKVPKRFLLLALG